LNRSGESGDMLIWQKVQSLPKISQPPPNAHRQLRCLHAARTVRAAGG
jgi:hypothetical protein